MHSPVVGGTIVFALTRGRINRHRNRSLVNQLEHNWEASAREKVIVSPTSYHHVRPGVSRHINDNYCINAPVPRRLTWSKETVKLVKQNNIDCDLVSVSPDRTSVRRDITSLSGSNKCCKFCCKSCTCCTRAATKERH